MQVLIPTYTPLHVLCLYEVLLGHKTNDFFITHYFSLLFSGVMSERKGIHVSRVPYKMFTFLFVAKTWSIFHILLNLLYVHIGDLLYVHKDEKSKFKYN